MEIPDHGPPLAKTIAKLSGVSSFLNVLLWFCFFRFFGGCLIIQSYYSPPGPPLGKSIAKPSGNLSFLKVLLWFCFFRFFGGGLVDYSIPPFINHKPGLQESENQMKYHIENILSV